MTTEPMLTQELEPFFISPYPARGAGVAISPPCLPTPLLDPGSLEAARIAYQDAIGELRVRARSSLRPAVRHRLANRILGFAVFGERDPRALADRALAHFP